MDDEATFCQKCQTCTHGSMICLKCGHDLRTPERFNLQEFYQQQSEERDAAYKAFRATVAGQVVSMQERERAYVDLIGEIIATLSIPQNRDNIRHGIGIDALFEMADRWKARRDRIAER